MASDPAFFSSSDFVALRHHFLVEVLHPAGMIELVETQLSLAETIREAEVAQAYVPRRSEHFKELQYVCRHLRILGDTVSWLMMDPHTLRSLAKGPHLRPAAIKGQSEGFSHLAQTARSLASEGRLVLLVDVSNVVRNGDLITIAEGGEIEVVECKRSVDRPQSSRSQRQINRVAAIGKYTRSGWTDEPSLVRSGFEIVALDGLPATFWPPFLDSVADKVLASGESEVVRLSDLEFVVVGAHDGGAPSSFPSNSSSDLAASTLHFGFSSDLVNEPDFLHPPVTLWPASDALKTLLWDKELIVSHAVSATQFIADRIEGHDVSILRVEPSGELAVEAEGVQLTLARSFVDSCIYDWEKPESVVRRAAAFALRAVNVQRRTEASPGPEVLYRTV